MSKINVVGFDPSLASWGIAQGTIDLESLEVTINNLELVKTEIATAKTVRKNCDDLRRATLLHEGMVRAAGGTSIAFVEIPVGSQSARAMASYGVCCGVLAGCPVPIIPVLPHEVKIAAVNHKQAAKEEMIEAAMKLHPNANWLTVKRAGKLEPTAANEHLADAIFAIYAGLKTGEFLQLRSLLTRMRAAA